jgi:hypothetical protein
MFQQKMESMSVILMLQVAEFMKEHIVLQDFRQTVNVQIKIYV